MIELFHWASDIFLHLDRHLAETVAQYGTWTYALLVVIVFCETGLVFTPILPGDSLIFAAGALAATSSLNVFLVFVLLSVAAILGDTVNYWIGNRFGAYLISHKSRFIKPEHLARTHAFFEKYGGKTIVIARFAPIVRTFAPFVAGMGAMSYARFIGYNIFGGILWVAVCTAGGFLFGNMPFVREHFSIVILGIVAVSLIPAVYGALAARAETPAKPVTPPVERQPVE
jgi:membrane-associated protein